MGRTPRVSRPDRQPDRTQQQLGRSHQRPGLLTGGQLTALLAIAGTAALLVHKSRIQARADVTSSLQHLRRERLAGQFGGGRGMRFSCSSAHSASWAVRGLANRYPCARVQPSSSRVAAASVVSTPSATS